MSATLNIVPPTADSPEFQHLPLNLIDPDPDNPRGDDDGEDMPELVASVGTHGVLQPILVRPLAGRYRIVAGERRFRASTANNRPTIPAVVREMTDDEAEEIQLIENAQRKDPDPVFLAMRLAKTIERMRKEGSQAPQDDLAAKLGKSKSWISDQLFCGRCGEDVQDLIRKGITRSIKKIRELDNMRGEKRARTIAAALEAGKLTDEILNPPKPKRERTTRTAAPIAPVPLVAIPEPVTPATVPAAGFVVRSRYALVKLIRNTGLSMSLPVGWDTGTDAQLSAALQQVEDWILKGAQR